MNSQTNSYAIFPIYLEEKFITLTVHVVEGALFITVSCLHL